MKKAYFALIAIIVLGPLSARGTVGVGSWSNNGPEGAFTPKVYIDLSSPSTLYLTGLAIYRSSDGGGTWKRVREVNGPLAVAASNSRILFHGEGPLLARSDDEGSSWAVLPPLPASSSPLPSNCQFSIDSVAVDTLNPNLVLIVRRVGPCTHGGEGFYGEILQSRDGGFSWLIRGSFHNSVPPIVAGPRSFWALGPQLLRSTDGGSSFDAVLPAAVNAIAFDPEDVRRVYAGVSGSLMLSRDEGDSWETIDLGLEVTSILVNGAEPSEIFAKSGNVWFRSVNYGGSWHPYPTGGTDLLAIDPSNPAVFYGHDGSEVRKTNDHAANWNPIVGGLKATAISSLAVDSSRPGHAYAAANGALSYDVFLKQPTDIYETTDAGQTWARRGSVPAQYVGSLTFDPLFGALYAGGDLGVFGSEDGGATWNLLVVTERGGFTPIVTFAPSDPRILYATGDFLFRSVDRGKTWDSFRNLYSPVAVVTDPRNADVVYANGYLNSWPLFWKSTDSGATWTRLVEAGGKLLIDPVEPRNLYIVSDFVHYSPDGGLTWTLRGKPFRIYSLDGNWSRPGDLLALALGVNGTVLRSLDYGVSWRPLPDVPDFGAGASFVSLDHDVLYVATSGMGIFTYAPVNLSRTRPARPVPFRH